MKSIIMPKLGFTMTESTIVQWLKQEGEAVTQGEPIAEITTDKVNMEVEAPEDGILAGFKYHDGDTVPVTEVIAYVLRPGESLPKETGRLRSRDDGRRTTDDNASSPVSAVVLVSATPIAARMAAELGIDLATVKGSGPAGRITREDITTFTNTPTRNRSEPAKSGSRVRATPNARRLSREAQIDIATVNGSGPNGRVQGDDVRVAVETVTSASPMVNRQSPIVNTSRTLPYTGMRKTIGTRLQQSYQQVPHITLDVDVDTSAAEALRAKANANLKAGATKIGLTAIITKACAWALQRHPLLNSQLDEAAGHITLLDEVNIGIAVALENGLIVPVIHQANAKGIQQIAADIGDVSARAKANKLKAHDIQGGTFSISNLGMFGVDRFTAIINPPETAILAVGASKPTFVPDANGQPVLRPMLTLRLSADHRVIDGAVAAQFLADVRAAIESPALMTL